MPSIQTHLPFDEQPVERDHLDLPASDLSPERRREPRRYRPPAGVDRPERAAHLREQAEQVTVTFQRITEAPSTLDVDPALILVLEGVAGQTGLSGWGLRYLDDRDGNATVAFADDDALSAFLDRLEDYDVAEPEDPDAEDAEKAQFYGFFDALTDVRAYGPQDRLSSELDSVLGEMGADGQVVVDVECWASSDNDTTDEWHHTVVAAAEVGEGEVVDSYVNHAAGLSLIRVLAGPSVVRELAQLHPIRRIETLPSVEEFTDPSELTIDDLPAHDEPDEAAPLVALLDSGVQQQHPLLAGCVTDALHLVTASGADHHGHGTAVASRILYGESLDSLATPNPELSAPPCRIVSLKVLDDSGRAPTERLFPGLIDEAIRLAHSRGARIFCLALADETSGANGDRPGPIAAVLDQLAAELDIVVFVPTGNVRRSEMTGLMEGTPPVEAMLDGAWPNHLLDPATAAFALTVNATGRDAPAPALPRRTLSRRSDPAVYGRVAAETSPQQKPELSAVGGSLTLDPPSGHVLALDAARCIVASADDARIVEFQHGTSLSVAAAVRAGVAVLARYPDATNERIRALVLQSCPEPRAVQLAGASGVEKSRATRRLLGHGTPSEDRAAFSEKNDVVLIVDQSIDLDKVHYYTLSVPPTFHESGGQRGVEAALSFTCPARAHRQDYLRAQFKLWIIKGMDPDEVFETFSRVEDRDEDDGVISDLSDSKLVLQQPAITERARGANVRARRRMHQRLISDDDTMVVIVSAMDKWRGTAKPEAPLDYTLAVRLWRRGVEADLYSEIESDLQQRAQAQAQVEV